MTSRPNRTEANVPADVRDIVGAGGSNLNVLQQSDDFLVIDKPANLRMDGLFENTVEKLVYQCLPLLKWSPLKWVHQLDYATSGVLCIALNRPAAARASLAFAERLTTKQYLAVVRGHLDPLKWQHKGVMNSSGRSSSNSSSSTSSVTNSSSSSCISKSSSNSNISNSRNSMICCSTGDVSHHHQQDHDNRLHPMAKKSSVGIDAAVSDTTTNTPAWQEETKLLNLHACYNKFLELLATSSSSFSSTAEGHKQPVTAGMVDDHLLPLSKKTFVDFEKSAKLRKQLRKALKVCGVKHDYVLSTTGNVAPGPDEDSTDHGAAATATAAAATLVLNTEIDSNDDFSDLISTVATPEPNDHIGDQAPVATASTSTSLLVQVPVAEHDNDFRCTASRLRGKPCETIVRVLQYAYYNREPVTKLLLMPTTGRRHQLRVHCKVLGHPILGDFTYGSDKAVEDACPRMYLHAWKLRIPLTTPDQLRKRKQGQDVVWGEGDVIDVSTPDPFVVEYDALIG